MNNIWRKNIYHGAIDSYVKMPRRFKIKGTLLETKGNEIRVDIGGEKVLHITLDKPMEAQVGEDVVIDRRDIVDSKLVRQPDEVPGKDKIAQELQDKYAYILKSFDISVNDESIKAIKILESHGVHITKENILSFIRIREQLLNISEKLDYDTAVKLTERDIDFHKKPLQEILQEIKKIQNEKRPFSFLRFLGIEKDINTEEAERIAYEIYGNKMGKDITDIIKALDKAGLDVSRENIEQINNIFSKLYDIKDIENKTIIDSVKNKIETTIDNLYKLKNAVVKGTIKAEQKLGQLASKVYETYSGAISILTEKELTQMESDIKDRLQYMGIDTTDEIIELSKDIITKGLNLTKENLQKMIAIKRAIVGLNSDLNYEKTALLLASGIEVEKTDVVELVNTINIKYLEYRESAGNIVEDTVKNKIAKAITEYNKKDSKEIDQEKIDKNISINAQKMQTDTEKTQTNIEEIEIASDKMADMINTLKQISPERKNAIISLLMKNAMPLTLKKVQNLSFFLNNQSQIGHQLKEISDLLTKSNNMEVIKISEEFKKTVVEINRHIKEGKQIKSRPYENFSKLLKELESKSSFLTTKDRETFQKSSEGLLDSLETQLQLNREDTVLQLPLIMNEHLKNLQIYVMKGKKGRKKIDPQNMSMLLNFDTNNMGNINIYIAVNYKNIVMKIGLTNENDKKFVEKHLNELEESLRDLGYNLKDLSFRIDEDNHIFSAVADEIEENSPKIKRLLDVRI